MKKLREKLVNMRKAARVDSTASRKGRARAQARRTTITLNGEDHKALGDLRQHVQEVQPPSTSQLVRLALRYTRRALTTIDGRTQMDNLYDEILSMDGRKTRPDGA